MWIHHTGSYTTKTQNIISTQWVKKQGTLVLPITLPDADQFSKFCSVIKSHRTKNALLHYCVKGECSEIDLTSEYSYKYVILWELIWCFCHGSAISKISAWSAWRDAVYKSWVKPTTTHDYFITQSLLSLPVNWSRIVKVMGKRTIVSTHGAYTGCHWKCANMNTAKFSCGMRIFCTKLFTLI